MTRNAKWIWPENCETVNAYAWFEDAFDATGEQPIEVRISVSGEYVLFLNDEVAGFGQYSDWPESKTFNLHQLACKEGENRFRLWVWHQNLDCSMDVAAPARVWFQVSQGRNILMASDEDTPCRQDVRYRQGSMWMITGQLGYGFEFDGRQALPPMGKAVVVDAPAELNPRPIRKLALGKMQRASLCGQGVYSEENPQIDRLSTRMRRAALSKRLDGEMMEEDGWMQADSGDGIYLIYDLGRESVGYFTLDIDLSQDAEILVGFGEHLKDQRVRMEIESRNFVARITLPAGRTQFTHWFRRWGCRYLQLHIPAKRARVRSAGILPVDYPVDESAAFRCGDGLHNRIFDVSRHTLKMCMHSHYEDCPWREQALYAMDSRIQMLCGYSAFGETDMPRESLRLLARSIREDGMLELCAPAKIAITIPCFSLAFIIALWEYVLYTGDVSLAEELLPTSLRILEAVQARDDGRGRINCFKEKKYWNFFEWQPGLDGGEIVAQDEHPVRAEGLLTAYYALALEAAEKLCAVLEKDGAVLKERRSRTVAALNDFWDAEKGLYAAFLQDGEKSVYSALMQSLALLCGAADEDRAKNLRERLAKGEGMIPVTLNDAMSRYQALMQDEETYADFVFDEIAEIWGRMLCEGATSFWETELGDRDFNNAGSLCHGWSAVPVYFYYAYGLGLRPEAPGKPGIFETKQTVLGSPTLRR